MPMIRIPDPEQAPLVPDSTANSDTSDDDEDGHWEYKLNLFSAAASLLSLLILLMIDRAMLFKFQTWAPFTTSVRSATSVGLVRNFTSHYEEVCEITNLSIAKFDVNVSNDGKITSYLVMPLAYDVQQVPASPLLIWVLAVSAAYQTYRGRFLPLLRNEQLVNRFWSMFCIIVLHLIVHATIIGRLVELELMEKVNIAIFVISLLILCLLIIIHPFAEDYQNNTPDVGRWFEYTLTAPVQVVLVALSVWSRDRSTLYALFAAQASMMLCGVVMEECIEEIYETNEVEDPDQPSDKRKRVVRTARGTLVIAWVTFALIWYVLISQFLRQGHIDGKCDDCGSYRTDCPVLTSPTLTFQDIVNRSISTNSSGNSTVIPTCQSCPITAPDDMCKIADGKCVGRSNIPPAVSYIVFAQCFLFASFGIVQTIQYVFSSMVNSEEDREKFWYGVSIAYAVLSVTAKTTLEIAFLAMLAQMPESVVGA